MSANRSSDRYACSWGQERVWFKMTSTCGYSDWMAFLHCRDGLLIWEEILMFQCAFFFPLYLKPDSSQTKELSPNLPRIVPGAGESWSCSLTSSAYTFYIHMARPEMEGLFFVGFSDAQNRSLITPGHMRRSRALPLPVDNFTMHKCGRRGWVWAKCQFCQLDG